MKFQSVYTKMSNIVLSIRTHSKFAEQNYRVAFASSSNVDIPISH